VQGRPPAAKTYQEDEVRKWATQRMVIEFILRLSPDLLPPEQLRMTLQWAFPQAYYSAFALILALYKTTAKRRRAICGASIRFGEQVGPAATRPASPSVRQGLTQSRSPGRQAPLFSSLAFDP